MCQVIVSIPPRPFFIFILSVTLFPASVSNFTLSVQNFADNFNVNMTYICGKMVYEQ